MSGATGGSRAGTRFGPYYLRRLIGAGGFGEVYEAQDTVRGRIVALKLLPEALSNDPVFRKRMQREAQAAGRLQEPHVVPIHDYGEIDGLLYVDMRLIDGTDLRAVLKGGGPLPSARAVAIVGQIASALDAAHAAGVMHRDIKPENILVTDDDFAYLVDFGLATAAGDERLTRIGSMVGTFSYMSPERFRNMELTHRSDIYSLACVLHECLTGSRPYDANELGAMITAHLTAPIPRPSMIRPGIPAGFNTVIERGMAKNPEGRYASAGEMALAALDVLGSTEKRRATTIFERSKEATQPKGAGVIREAPTTPYRPPPPTLPPVAPSSAPPTIGSGPMQRFAAPGYTPQRNFGSGPQQAVTPPPYSSGPQYPVTPPATPSAYSSGSQYPATPPAWTPQSPRSGPEPSKGKRKLWVLGGAIAVLIAVLVVGFWKPGFFVTTALDVTRAQAEIQRVLTDETDGYDAKNVEDLKCNDGQNPTAKKGDTFDCEVTIDGTKREVTVTFQDNNGAFEVGRPK